MVVVPHKLKASTGTRGKSMFTGGPINHVTSEVTNLANARVPKYIASSLFLRVIAYMLRWGHISWLSDLETNNTPQRDENV